MVEAEEEEGLEVVIADTISNPGTVMVHFGHADVANATMVRSLRLPVPTMLAVQILIRRRCLRDDFWLLQRRHSVGE